MTLLPPSPFLNPPPEGTTPAAALPIGAAAVLYSSDSGAGEAYRPPPGYVLVERELLGRVVKRLREAAIREREQLRDTPWAFLLRGAE